MNNEPSYKEIAKKAVLRGGFKLYATVLMALCSLTIVSGCNMLAKLKHKDASDSSDPKLSGERIAIFNKKLSITASPELSGQKVIISQPIENKQWIQAGSGTDHMMGSLAAAKNPVLRWEYDIGDGSSTRRRLVAQPIVALDTIYSVNAKAILYALNSATGEVKWEFDLNIADQAGNVGFLGGIGYDNGVIYATTGYGWVIAIDAKSGQELWRKSLKIPFRSPPTIANGSIFAITQDNQLNSLSTKNGDIQWSYVGLREITGYLGSASPAIYGNTVVAPFSSGELVALRTDNGSELWQTSLIASEKRSSIDAIDDIRGQIVINNNEVIAASTSSLIQGLDLNSGEQRWSVPFGSANTPVLDNGTVFIQSNSNELMALNNGRAYWVVQLEQYEDAQDQEDAIVWYGPVLAGGQLVLAGSNEKLIFIAPDTGEILSTIDLPGAAAVPPVVANNTIYVLLDDGELLAFSK